MNFNEGHDEGIIDDKVFVLNDSLFMFQQFLISICLFRTSFDDKTA